MRHVRSVRSLLVNHVYARYTQQSETKRARKTEDRIINGDSLQVHEAEACSMPSQYTDGGWLEAKRDFALSPVLLFAYKCCVSHAGIYEKDRQVGVSRLWISILRLVGWIHVFVALCDSSEWINPTQA